MMISFGITLELRSTLLQIGLIIYMAWSGLTLQSAVCTEVLN